MVTLLTMLLKYSNYTSKKKEVAHFEEKCKPRGAMVGELQHSDVYSITGWKKITRTLLSNVQSDGI